MTYPFVISPMLVQDFESEDELIERCKEWNLLSTTATRVKTYLYKRQGLTLPCEIVGYVDPQTVVIQFENNQQHCIHPAYLKEMQTAAFGSRAGTVSEAAKTEDSGNDPEEAVAEEGAADAVGSAACPENSGDEEATPSMAVSSRAEEAVAIVAGEPPEAPKKKPAKSPKKVALVLPEEKLQMTAVVKEFTTVPNHFSDNDDEVIIYEGVAVEGHDLAIDEIWSSHSATLKKLELAVGDTVSFEAKVVAKKLTQHPVKYKINNPSKMKKVE
ncbi:hypothetical protein [Paenibacillus sp. P32E]|uniref:hypothetical protein n=1 Tax=Paenibacillus sp. P32E TaxID=1349434 RepID=UPI00093D9E03|nr:hypothetical protein [Paenibacillus sp. P32E]OKP93005.1 hypothetical protein A3848_06420 [Paenibacillus sp. P32E]